MLISPLLKAHWPRSSHLQMPVIDPGKPEKYDDYFCNLNTIANSDAFIHIQQPHYYLYQIKNNSHTQLGVLARIAIADYCNNLIRGHEHTLTEREIDIACCTHITDMQAAPVMLIYRSNYGIFNLLKKLISSTPVCEVQDKNNTQHTLWAITDLQQITSITTAFTKVECMYIADGHHRVAAALRIAKMHNNSCYDFSYNYFFAALFPDNQINILSYHRLVKDLNSYDSDVFLKLLAKNFLVTASENPVLPKQAGHIGMYLKNQWYELSLISSTSSFNQFSKPDTQLLADTILQPLLNIKCLLTDKRVNFLPGNCQPYELTNLVDSGKMAAAFTLPTLSIETILSLIDKGHILPPKSTWFEFKPAPEFVFYPLNQAIAA